MKHASFTSLFIFALTVFRLLDPESSTSSALVLKSVTAAISKVDFFRPKPDPVRNHHYWQNGNPPETVDPNLETFKTCLKHCFTVQCPEAIVLVLEKVKQTAGMSATHVQNRVKDVMLPLLLFIAHLRSQNPGVLPSLAVKDFTQTAITVFLGSVSSVEREAPANVVRSLAKADASVEGGIELVATM